MLRLFIAIRNNYNGLTKLQKDIRAEQRVWKRLNNSKDFLPLRWRCNFLLDIATNVT